METVKECVRASDNADVLNEFKCLELDKMHSWDTVGIGTCALSHCNYSLRNRRTSTEKQKKLGEKSQIFTKRGKNLILKPGTGNVKPNFMCPMHSEAKQTEMSEFGAENGWSLEQRLVYCRAKEGERVACAQKTQTP